MPLFKPSIRPDHGQINPFAVNEPNHRVGVQDVDRNRRKATGYPRVAWGANDMGNMRVLRELPGERVLTCAGAENEDPSRPIKGSCTNRPKCLNLNGLFGTCGLLRM